MSNSIPLGKTELDFCIAFVGGASQSEAYRQAFNCGEEVVSSLVSSRASTLLKQRRIKFKIAELRKPVVKTLELKVEEVVSRWIAIANADPSEIVRIRRVCCRHCYGVNHQYQWVEIEYALLCAVNLEKGLPLPEEQGGMGFNGTFEPNAECPKCFGEGKVEVYFEATENLTEEARILYAGVKQTKYGPEVILHDQARALENVAKFLGMFKDKLTSPPVASGLSVLALPKLSEITTDAQQAAKVYQEIMTGGV